jgi:hypothetical protein
VLGDLAGGGELDDLVGDLLADAFDLQELLFVLGQGLDVAGEGVDGAGGAGVGRWP